MAAEKKSVQQRLSMLQLAEALGKVSKPATVVVSHAPSFMNIKDVFRHME